MGNPCLKRVEVFMGINTDFRKLSFNRQRSPLLSYDQENNLLSQIEVFWEAPSIPGILSSFVLHRGLTCNYLNFVSIFHIMSPQYGFSGPLRSFFGVLFLSPLPFGLYKELIFNHPNFKISPSQSQTSKREEERISKIS